MRFVPYTELDGEPNVIVDGAETVNTRLTLSHWPGSRVPAPLQADLSAEIVVRYLERPALHVAADAVSNNHLDQDGLMGVWALIEPDRALAHRDLVIDVARAGDFSWSQSRAGARVSFAIGALLDAAPMTGEYPDYCARQHQALLPITADLVADPNAFRHLWTDEDAFLDDSNAVVDHGDITIEEQPDLDLAIVSMPSRPQRPYHRFAQRVQGPVHPMAIFNRTERTRVAYLRERKYLVELRYESVVQLVSRPFLPRPDLGILADRLNESETSGGKWRFDGVGGLTPMLRLHDAAESSIDRDDFLDELTSFLVSAEPAWDPWSETGFR